MSPNIVEAVVEVRTAVELYLQMLMTTSRAAVGVEKAGLLSLAGPAGVAVGPVLVSWIADGYSYTDGFTLCAMSLVADGIASFMCIAPARVRASQLQPNPGSHGK